MKSHYLLPLATLLLASCQTTPDRFAQADINADGKLSRDEGRNFLVSTIFATRDINKDHVLTKAEWNSENDPDAAKVFRECDANKDGKVTLEEALSHAKKTGYRDATLMTADTNIDGFISREEAKAFYASKEGPMR